MTKFLFLPAQSDVPLHARHARVFLENGQELHGLRSLAVEGESQGEAVVTLVFARAQFEVIDKAPPPVDSL